MPKPKVTPKIALQILEAKQSIETGKKLEEAFPITKKLSMQNIKDEKMNAIFGNDTTRHFIIGTFFKTLGLQLIENPINCNGSCESCTCKTTKNQENETRI